MSIAAIYLFANGMPQPLHEHMAKPLPTDLPYHSFASAKELDDFLAENGTKVPAFYLKIAKKATGIQSITADEAIEVGLCHGWIDGWGRSIDEDWYFKRYTPRRAKSIWSRKNIRTVARLVADGRMRASGMATIEAAQADGRWDMAYGSPAEVLAPEDLATALRENRHASTFFDGLSDAARFSVVWRAQAADSTQRAATIESLVDMLGNEELPETFNKRTNSKQGSGQKLDLGQTRKRTRTRDVAEGTNLSRKSSRSRSGTK